jgi:hypothetical protein
MRRARAVAAIAAGLLAVAALTARPARAVGPDLPIQIHVDVAEALVVLRVDENQITEVSAARLVYRNGDLVEKLPLEAKLEPPPEPREEPPCEPRCEPVEWREARFKLLALADELTRFEPGPYAVKLVVTGAWRVQPGAKLREERWLRFLVDRERVRPLTLRQYSDLVERAEIATDAEGRKTLVFVGGGPEEKIDARETKYEFDKAFGRFGGLEPERVETAREEQTDTSEKEEN